MQWPVLSLLCLFAIWGNHAAYWFLLFFLSLFPFRAHTRGKEGAGGGWRSNGSGDDEYIYINKTNQSRWPRQWRWFPFFFFWSMAMFKSPTYMTTNQLNDSQLQLVMTLLYLWRNTYFLLAGCGCGIATCSAPVKSLPRKPPHIYWCRAQVRVPGAVEMFGMPCARSVVFFPPPSSSVFPFRLSRQNLPALSPRPSRIVCFIRWDITSKMM